MKLPNRENAIVPQVKIVDYLLSATHPIGREKAEFFTRFGFSPDEWEIFAEALLQHASEHEVGTIETSDFGTYYVVEGSLESPDGRNPQVRVVWFVDKGQDIPRLASAYPLRRRNQHDKGT